MKDLLTARNQQIRQQRFFPTNPYLPTSQNGAGVCTTLHRPLDSKYVNTLYYRSLH